jgi:small nuclear ribonucleoprotein (snRNP)-like protein
MSYKSPANFIKQLLGRPVEVKLNDNYTFFQGTLSNLDGTMNVLLTGVKEVVGSEIVNEFKELLLRGNNVLYIKKNY